MQDNVYKPLKNIFLYTFFYRCYIFGTFLARKVYFCLMEITSEMIDRLARLARLKFTEEEKKELKIDLERMIEFVEKLKEVDTAGVEPLLHITHAVNVLREDEIKQNITKEEALLNVPLTDGNFFKVPKVIKK